MSLDSEWIAILGCQPDLGVIKGFAGPTLTGSKLHGNKTIAGRANDWIWVTLFSVGLGLGAINTFFFTKALKTMSLSIAYPVFSGACIGLMVLVGVFVFQERISLLNVLGFLVVGAGIALVMS